MPPTILAEDFRGQAEGTGPARVYKLDGGLFLDQIGPDKSPGGGDVGRGASNDYRNRVIRFRGQLVTFIHSTTTVGHVVVFDEGGTNAWEVGITAKGMTGYILSVDPADAFGGFDIVQTDTQDYLCAWFGTAGTTPRALRYDPDNGVNGTWSEHTSSGGIAGTPEQFVWNGILYAGFTGGNSVNNNHSFDPSSGSAVNTGNPVAQNSFHRTYFTLYDRLFQVPVDANVGTFGAFIEEFTLGAWASTGVAHNHGASSSGGANITAFAISPTKVLLIGTGGASGAAGLKATLVETVGDSPTGALSLSDVTTPVIPAALRPTSAVGNPLEYRVSGYTDTSTTPGSKTHWLYFHNDGVATATIGNLFQVTDELTEMVDFGPAGSDSDFCYPDNFYGGGQYQGGVDGSTRYVSVSPRGYSADTSGLRVLCSAHGDATVLAYHNLAGGPFTVGEVITGGTSGATATLMGDGAAEGLYVRDVTGVFAPDEQVTGGTSGATADLNTVLQHGAVTGGPFVVAEVVTGGTSGATGNVTHLGIGGAGEALVKVELTAGTFVNGETLTGGTSGAVATATAGPAGSHGGAANKKIRARFFLGAGPSGKGVPISGACTMVAGSGFKGVVSKGTGPSGEDELINVVADGGVGGDTPASFEWDFLADGVGQFLAENVSLEIDRV